MPSSRPLQVLFCPDLELTRTIHCGMAPRCWRQGRQWPRQRRSIFSLPISSVPVVRCSVLPPASAPPFHHSTIPRASAWKASRIAARAPSIHIVRTTAVPEAKAVVTTRGGSLMDSLVVDWTRPLSQAPKPSKPVVYKSEPPVRPPPPATAWTSIGEPLCSHLFASSTDLQMWGSASKSQSDAAQPTSVPFSERHAARQDGGPGSGSGSTCCGGCPASRPPLPPRPPPPLAQGQW